MKVLPRVLAVLIGLSIGCADADQSIGTVNLQSVYAKLNLTSFRNSTGPARRKEDKYFSDLGLQLSELTSTAFVVETEDWVYTVTVLEIKDFNGDGIVDIAICFNDNAKLATYHAQQSILITQYVEGEDYIALKFEVDGCVEFVE